MAVLADRELGLEHLATGYFDTRLFDGAILAAKVHQRATAARGHPVHLGQHAACARAGHVHRKGQHLHVLGFALGRLQLSQLALEHRFVELARARHVLHVDLKPDDGIGFHGMLLGG
uniref:Uncharacterized protein n=1 Tax=Acinetobacter nosocomialis TaxID=106654 RepID=A0A7S9DRB2_ACINO|nr:hypothetical protein WM98B_00137 [Acinetobacter nosocomialis]